MNIAEQIKSAHQIPSTDKTCNLKVTYNWNDLHMEALERGEVDQDWENGTTTYTFQDRSMLFLNEEIVNAFPPRSIDDNEII